MRNFARTHALLTFYALTFAISWPAWGVMAVVTPNAETPGPLTLVFSTLGGLGPLLALGLLGRLTAGELGLRKVLAHLRVRGAAKGWFLPAIGALPGLTLAATLIYAALGRDLPVRLIKPGPDELGWAVLPVIGVHFIAALWTSPLFEEPGWRGFALPRLQARFGSIGGSLVVGCLWWLWHQPMNAVFGLWPTPYAFASMLLLSFMIDSLFNLSGANVFVAMLAHQSSGSVITFLNQGHDNLAYLVALAVVVIGLRLRETATLPRPGLPEAGSGDPPSQQP